VFLHSDVSASGALFTVNPHWPVFTPENIPLDSLVDLTGPNWPSMVNIDHIFRFGGFASMNNRKRPCGVGAPADCENVFLEDILAIRGSRNVEFGHGKRRTT
jgi:hypothetical protein